MPENVLAGNGCPPKPDATPGRHLEDDTGARRKSAGPQPDEGTRPDALTTENDE